MRLAVTPRARRDVRELLVWSQTQFGRDARGRYRRLIQFAYEDLRIDPQRLGVQSRFDLSEGIFLFHLRHSRKRQHISERVVDPRHFVVFRWGGEVVEIVRVLHDAMDLARHL